MKKNSSITEIVFLLDHSEKSVNFRERTIRNFNSMIEKLQQKNLNLRITTALYNDKIKLLHDGLQINDVQPMRWRDYRPSGNTAFLDAMGLTFKHVFMRNRLFPKQDRSKRTLVFIWTNTQENASTVYSELNMKIMMDILSNCHHWDFLYCATTDGDEALLDRIANTHESPCILDFGANFISRIYNNLLGVLYHYCLSNKSMRNIWDNFI